MISTVNFHLTRNCNYQCKYCFAHFCETNSQLDAENRKKLVKTLCSPKWVKKINFVGGEPTLIGNQLIDLMKIAKSEKAHKVETSVTTNSSLISPEWIACAAPYLDILTVSIDSYNEETNRKCGRCCKSSGKVLTKEHYLALAKACHENNIALKINTVVSSINLAEDMADFINEIRPFHWKVFQVLKVDGENDVDFQNYAISKEEFDTYIDRQRNILNEPNVLVKESNELMRGSYLMVNPEGRFFDNSKGGYTISEPILEVGMEKALNQIHYDKEKFLARGGHYSIPEEANTEGAAPVSQLISLPLRGEGVVQTELKNIVSIESPTDPKEQVSNNKIVFFTNRKPGVLVDFTSSRHIEEKLHIPTQNMVEVYRGIYVNVLYITNLKENNLEVNVYGEAKPHRIPVSRRHKREVCEIVRTVR